MTSINNIKIQKILHIAEPFATGVLSFLLDITKKQVDKYDVYILYGIRPLTPPNVESLFDKRIHLIKVDEFKGALRSVLNPQAYHIINKYYKQIKPDIVHLHSSAAGFIGRWGIPCSQTKVFYTPHGYSFLMQDGSALKRLIYWSIEYFSAKRKAKTIACSEGEYKEACKLSSNSTYVNNGINTKELQPYIQESQAIHNPIKICTSGRILYQKNPQLFNDIACLVPNAEFIWIGEGELKTKLTSPNIKVTGWISREEALKTLQGIDIFILPSLWEGLPISLLEAMFLKKVCLVSNVIGNRDVIKSGFNGFICNTAQEYASIIKQISNKSLETNYIQENAHQDVLHNYNVELMAEKYSTIYNSK